MAYPLQITTKRVVDTGGCSRIELLERLDFWADRYRFERTADDDDSFVYHRGSHWHALYTFDIRKVPTEVRIRTFEDESDTCVCTMTCGSWLQFSTPGDEKRLSDELDLLAACLRGAFTEQKARMTSEFHDEDDRSHDIQISKEHYR